MNIKKKIVAIGGGGFTHKTDPELDVFILSQCEKKKIKLGFLPTASKDDEEKIKRFYHSLEKYNLELSHFELTKKIDGFEQWIFKNDIIYLGGGNTSYMLQIWENKKLKNIFREVYNAGIVLCGVSAGAICWFDWSLTDSLGPEFMPLRGINLISGSCTPHSSDLDRMKNFQYKINNNELPPGIAIDDGVAVLFVNGHPEKVCSSRKGSDAYFIDKNNKISLKHHILKK